MTTLPITPNTNILDYRRDLGSDDDNDQSYLVDKDGNEYEPYSMAWRYLGMYIDCDVQQQEYDDEDIDESDVNRRQRRRTIIADSTSASTGKRRYLSGSDDGDDCSRKVLWAAYYDPKYRGNSIGEYQFYDRFEKTWDKSTCQSGHSRCAKMDCHASSSHFKLIGVFKEADGLVDWAEQLFKHEGYCVWDGDKDDEDGSESGDEGGDDDDNYDFMSSQQENIVQECTGMYLTDDDGNSLYRHVKPLGEGNITEGLYTDEDCTQRSYMSFQDYIVKWYTNYYYDSDRGQQVAEKWEGNTLRWNELMTDWKVCQPCRAYNKIPTYDDEDDRLRFLRRLDDNDGEGDEEAFGYNCYDDAGYRNCNQCYKFETQTDMEPASTADLERASAQGTILGIRVEGVNYGRGGIDWHDIESQARMALFVLVGFAVFGTSFLVVRYYGKSISKFFFTPVKSRRSNNKSLRETFVVLEEKPWSNEMEDELSKKKEVIEEQRREIEQMKLEIDQQHSIREAEWEMNRRELKKYKTTSNIPESSELLDGEKRDDGEENTEAKITESKCIIPDTDTFIKADDSEEKLEGGRMWQAAQLQANRSKNSPLSQQEQGMEKNCVEGVSKTNIEKTKKSVKK